jgi:hypothetical protein
MLMLQMIDIDEYAHLLIQPPESINKKRNITIANQHDWCGVRQINEIPRVKT